MLITVIVCTRNRARQLRNLLESFLALDPPAQAEWEMIIVDNGSTDDTARVIDEFGSHLPLRRVWEPRAGLSNARNAGVAASKGDYICWTDDDVEVHQQWLSAYAQAFHRHPDGTIFGGVVEPVYEESPPHWMVENADKLVDVLAKRDHGLQERRLTTDLHLLPYGANFAVRAEEQRRFLYDPHLGVSPEQKRLGEETVLLVSVASLGGAHYWVPDSRVRHLIPTSRMTFDYIGTYFQSVGETWAYLSTSDGVPIMGQPIPMYGRRFGGVPLWIWRQSVVAEIVYRIKRTLRPSPSRWLDDLINKSRLAGARNFLWRHHRSLTQIKTSN